MVFSLYTAVYGCQNRKTLKSGCLSLLTIRSSSARRVRATKRVYLDRLFSNGYSNYAKHFLKWLQSLYQKSLNISLNAGLFNKYVPIIKMVNGLVVVQEKEILQRLTSLGERVLVTKSGWPLNRGQIPLISYIGGNLSCH
eukprot:sb/3474276/